MYLKVETREVICEPAAVNADEVIQAFRVSAGDRLLFVSMLPLVAAAASTNSSFEIGLTGGDTDGFSGAIDTEAMVVGSWIDLTGALLVASGGYRFNAADTIDVLYTDNTTPGATKPRIKVRVGLVHEGP